MPPPDPVELHIILSLNTVELTLSASRIVPEDELLSVSTPLKVSAEPETKAAVAKAPLEEFVIVVVLANLFPPLPVSLTAVVGEVFLVILAVPL